MSLSAETIVTGLDTIATVEPAIARALARAGYPEPRIRARGYRTLLRTIPVGGSGVGQVLDLRLTSRVWPQVDALAATPLAAGLARTAADVRARVVSGGPLDA